MKVLHVINSLATGGAEKLLLESCTVYHQKGIEVHVLLLNGVVHPFLEELKRNKSCTIHVIGMGSVYSPVLLLKIIPFLKKFDCVHVHLFPCLYWVALAHALSFSKTKLIYTEHSTTNNRRGNPIFKVLDRWAYSRYSSIVAITPQVLENVKTHLQFKDENRFHIIQNGLNLSQIQSAQPYLKTDFFDDTEAKIIIQVARFFEPKDHATLIKSLSFLPENYKLILVGDGVLKPNSEALVSQLKLENRVQFLGVRTDVLSLLKTADVIVLSSKYEGLSLSCIEGMASGKPFVAADVPGLQEVVKNAGVLFPLGDEKALANEIKKLMEDELYCSEIVAQCISKSNEYDIQKMIDQYINLYTKK
ncbi:glycosyltransferase [Flavobacterium sp.]|uniref:glycosyltransferase n=1 Tax=Flavobacterium sp. TaxID=239 RepID=UPI002B4ACDC9|nr:glycosyltransferase [Flavobacterium sp.]HLP65546.1 glycosyltransferase [Flavobacterium sp.]